VSSLVRDGIDGIGVPADPGVLASALGRLLGDQEHHARLAAAAARRAEEHDWDEVARRFEAVLEETARSR
jgi:glycosyltransferase involved in cell wall biosynthesis